MTLAQLIVKLSLEAKDFHRDMESLAKRVEKTGKQISKIGREISTAISLPILLAGFAAFRTALDDSRSSFGPLFQAFEGLRAAAHHLMQELGRELTPVFLQLIGVARNVISHFRDMLQWYQQLSPSTKKLVVNTLLFLAALGPTVVIIGKLITVLGAIPKLMAMILSPVGLVAVAIIALGAAALYAATHWDKTKLRLLLFWTAVKTFAFDGVRFLIKALDFLTLGLTHVTGITEALTRKFDAFADRSLANSAAAILALEQAIENASKGLKEFKDESLTVENIMKELAEASRRLVLEAEGTGPLFDDNAARANAYGTAIRKLIESGVKLDQVLNKQGITLRGLMETYKNSQHASMAFQQALSAFGPWVDDQMRAIVRFNEILHKLGGMTAANWRRAAEIVTREGQQMLDVANAVKGGLQSALEELGSFLGTTLTGGSQAFQERMRDIRNEQQLMNEQLARGEISMEEFGKKMNVLANEASVLKKANQPLRQFGAMILGTIGGMAKAVGSALIAFGVAGIAIRKFIKSPGAAIAAGIALTALGAALQGAANRAVSTGGAALAGGAGASEITSVPNTGSGGSSDRPTIIYLSVVGQSGEEQTRKLLYDSRRFENLGGRVPGAPTRVDVEGVTLTAIRP